MEAAGVGGGRQCLFLSPKAIHLEMQKTKFTNLCQSRPTMAQAAGHTQWENQPWDNQELIMNFHIFCH